MEIGSRRYTYFLVYFVGFLDLLGVSMVIPLIEKYARDLGASPSLIGLLGSIYGGIQLFSSPIIGRWSDIYGRKNILSFCLLLTAVSYFGLSMANTVFALFLSRILTGTFKFSQDTAKTFLNDIVSKEDRNRLIGNFNAASSVGFAIGPSVGGYLKTVYGFEFAALTSAIAFFFNLALVFFFLPRDSKTNTEDTKSRQAVSTLEAIGRVDWRKMWDIFLVKFLMGLGVLVFRSNFALSLDDKFGATPQQVGYSMSYSGAVGTMAGLGVGFFTKIYKNDERLLLHIGFVQITNFILLTFAPNIYVFTLLLTPLGIVNQVARVCMTSITIERNNNQDVGILLGLSTSVMSFGRMCAPAINGFLLEINKDGPGIAAASSALIATLIMINKKTHRKKN